MDVDEIGGSCPRCDGEFRPGTTVCPDCGIPLVGVDDEAPAAPPPERAVPASFPDRSWIPRLAAFAAACVAVVGLQLAGGLLAVATYHEQEGIGRSHARARLLLTIGGSVELGIVVLVAGLAVALARSLGEGRQWPAYWTFVAGAFVVVLAAAGMVPDVAWRDDGLVFIPESVWSDVLGHAATLLAAGAGAWLTRAWVVAAEDPA